MSVISGSTIFNTLHGVALAKDLVYKKRDDAVY